jgi:hypothetical protein
MKRTYLYPSTFKFLAAIMIVMMALSSLPVSPASAATSTLVAWTKAYDQVSGTGTTTSFAIPGGSNRLLVVGIATNSTTSGIVGDPTAISYDSISLIKATGNGATDGRMHTWLYYLKENVVMDNTSNTLNVTMGSGSIVNMTVWYAVYAGVDQTATYSTGNALNNSSGSGPAQLSSDMSVNAGEQAIYISSIHDAVATTLPVYSINPNWTSGGSNTGTYTGGGNNRAWKNEVAHRAVPSSNTSDNAATSTITPTGSIRYAMSAMSLPPFRTATTLTPVALTDTYGNISSLSALLVPAASGKTIVFTLNGGAACSSTTNSSGLAACNLSSPGLKINVGTYPSGVSASFAGDTFYIASSGTAALTVNKRSITVTAITNTKVYDGGLTALATPTHSGLAVGDTADFTEAYLDKNVGSGNKVLVPAGVVTDGNSGNNYDYTYTNFTFGNITPASSTVTVTCPLVAQTYTGSAIEPCDASYLTEDGLSEDLIPTYTDNVFVGIATATAIYDGDSNHDGSENSANFEIIDITAPVLTINGATADGVDMAGDLPTGYILESNNNPALDRLIQFKAGTAADETLASEYFGLKLIDSTVSAADIKAYYVARSVPEPFLTYLNDAADGINPFVYIDGSTVKLVDAAKHDILATDVDMTIPDDFPLGTYTVEGQIKDLAGNETTVTLKLIVITVQLAQTIDVTLGAPATAAYLSEFTVAATGGGSGNPIVYTSSGNCTNIGAVLTMTSGTGTCTVSYNQAGNRNYLDATEVTEEVSATKLTQTIDVTLHAPASAAYLSGFTVAATGGASGNSIVYGTSGVCSIVGADVTMESGTGTCIVSYNQAGNADFADATEVTEEVIATKLTQAIVITTHAPAFADFTTDFTVVAHSDSALVVAYSATGACSNTGGDFNVNNDNGSCAVHYNQAGDANFLAAIEILEYVTVTNDTIAGARNIYTVPYQDLIDTTFATEAIDDPALTTCGGEIGLASVWYKYDPSSSREVSLDTFASDYNTMIGVWSGAPGSLTLVACNDDAAGTSQSFVTFAATAGTHYYVMISQFDDAPVVNGGALAFQVTTFADTPGNAWYWKYVEGFYAQGITTGCALGPFRYCPDRAVTRAEMAVFILRAQNGASYVPDPVETGMFADVPVAGKEWMQPWIEQFYASGLTTGCAASPFQYCPEREVTRAEMAVFILRSIHGASYVPPAATGVFSDLPVAGKEWMQPWIEQLYAEGITTGCASAPLRYCPEQSVTRAEMATFIDRAFDFPTLP